MPTRVSKPGKDISSSVLDDFYLHSDYPLLKVHSFGTFSTNILGSATINHNLGYRPYALVFSQMVDYNYSTNQVIISSEYFQHDWWVLGATDEWWGQTEITDTQLLIEIGQTWASPFTGVVNGFYYILIDEVG